MNQSVWAFHKETIGIVSRGIKKNFLLYSLLLVISILAIGTIVLAPFGIKFLYGMHEMLIVDGTIDYKKLFAQVDDDTNYFKTLLVLIVDAVIIAGGYVLFVIPGVILMLGLVPVNYFLYKGMNPKMSVIIPASMEKMNGHKTQLFLILLVAGIGYGVIYAVLTIAAFFLGQVYFLLAWPFLLVLALVSVIAAMYFFVLLVSFTRLAMEKPEQPSIAA